jgi:hypothetical protein
MITGVDTEVLRVPLTAWIPVHNVTWGAPQWPDDFRQCCEGLANSTRKILRHLDDRCVGSALWIADNNDIPPEVVSLNQSEYGFPKHYRVLKIDSAIRMRRSDVRHSDGTAVTDADLVGIAAVEFAGIAEDVLLLAAIAYPGRLHTKLGQVFVGGHGMNLIHPMPGFSRDHLYSEEQRWPYVGCRPLTQVLSWEKKVRLFQQDIATTSIQRALACYTRLPGTSRS